VSSSKRSTVLPDTPAIAEKIPGFSGTLWIWLFAPAGAPRAALTQLEGYMAKVKGAPEFKEKLLSSGVELASATPTEFATLLRDDLATWARIVKISGARVD